MYMYMWLYVHCTCKLNLSLSLSLSLSLFLSLSLSRSLSLSLSLTHSHPHSPLLAGLTPKELHLHLEVAVYYFFMQLYALFPCNLSQFLQSHYAHSSQEEVAKFQQNIVVSTVILYTMEWLFSYACVKKLRKFIKTGLLINFMYEF